MYEQVFWNLRKATEAAIQAQQEMFSTWANSWAGRPDQVQAFQKKWVDSFGELLKKQQETLEAQFQSGLKMIVDAFAVPTAKNPEELRDKLLEDWKKNFETYQQMAKAQMQAFQAAQAKWTDQAAKPMTPWDWWL
jgi:hypothetical protein